MTRRVLSIAGSDSGGGAGIQADLRTFAALGVWGTSAITSITVQNTRGVTGVADVPAETVAAQIRAVADDIGVDAAKTGMLSSRSIVEAVADAIDAGSVPNLVVDPVFLSKHGHALLREDAVDALRRRLVPLATLVTPNLPEAGGLVGFDVTSRDEMRKANYASVRGPYKYGNNHFPIQNFYLQDVVKDAEGNLTLKTVQTIVKDSQDSFHTKCPMKW